MRKIRFLLALLVGLTAVFWPLHKAEAARGIPGSHDFGYGARLELDGPYFEDALEMAAGLQLDWLAVTLHWSELPSDRSEGDWTRLDQAMQYASKNHISVLVSLTQPPSTALKENGPDPIQTGQLVLELAQRYPVIMQAVELFPGANTRQGWYHQPDPQAYAQLYQYVQDQLQHSGSPVLLVAAGLTPIAAGSSEDDMDDLLFLKGLYRAGVSMPIISIQLNQVTGDPLAPPDQDNHFVLRHYEEVRQTIVASGGEKEVLWITSFRSPSGKIQLPQAGQPNETNQTNWLIQAYTQLRSQLYIGVAFYQSLNPLTGSTINNYSLIQNDQQYHPFYAVLRDLINQNSPDNFLPQHGRPKTDGLDKNRT